MAGRGMDMDERVTETAPYMAAALAALRHKATLAAGITAMLPAPTMAVAAFTVAAEDSTAAGEATEAAAIGN
jgi:hypothetical protein